MNRESEMSLLIGMLYAIGHSFQAQFNHMQKENFEFAEKRIEELFYKEDKSK